MRVPGGNILRAALGAIGAQTVTYHQFLHRTENEIGLDVATYAPAQPIKGSLQPVPRSRYLSLGLDMNKNYVMFYCPKDLLDIQRDVSGDQIVYCGDRYQVDSASDWFKIDGWVGVLCVQVPNAG